LFWAAELLSGRSAGKRRTVRRSLGLITRGSAELILAVKLQSGRSARMSRTVRHWIESWGRPDLAYIRLSLSLLPPNRVFLPKSTLSFSLKHVGKTSRSRLFGVIRGQSEHIPGLLSSFFIMSSRYFDESLTLVLGFLHWKELGLVAPIYFWAMDSYKYLGHLVPSDEEMV
jgi:hypothetical protein